MMNRRTFLTACAALTVHHGSAARAKLDIETIEHERVLRNAKKYLADKPQTVTAAQSKRSTGGAHDFFSEGDYWWPDPKNPDGPYIQRDGMTNPENFVEHRKFLMKLSVQAPALTAAWKLTKDRRYSDHAAAHIRAWFVDEPTRMIPNLQYAQAIHGRSAGRGTGVIDAIHLVEVARAIPFLAQSGSLSPAAYEATKKWFEEYVRWMTTSKNGTDERDTKNNHATCWLMQVASFTKLTGNTELLKWSADRYKTVIVPGQIQPDGSLPLEMARTKPYGYCLFNLEALATLCEIVSETGDDLWNFKTPDGRGISKAIEYMYPYIRDKKSWPKPPDVMYFEYWPMRQESLLFGGLAYNRTDYLDLWQKLPADSDVDEVIRNYFIRQPVLWT
jgi:Alginate lyase